MSIYHIDHIDIEVCDGGLENTPEGQHRFYTWESANQWMNHVLQNHMESYGGFDILITFDDGSQFADIDFEVMKSETINYLQDKLKMWQLTLKDTPMCTFLGGVGYVKSRIDFWNQMIYNETESEYIRIEAS